MWQASGLQNEQVRVLAVDPNHLDDLYAGAANAGIFASTDAGGTWDQRSAGLPLPITVAALAFDVAGTKLYAATSAGLFVSANDAQSWTLVSQLPVGAYTALAFVNNAPKVVYVGNAHGDVFSSSNDGATWTKLSAGLPTGAGVTSLLYDANAGQLWVAFAGELYRSTDNGRTWQEMNNGLPAHVVINALSQGDATDATSSLLFLATNQGFFLSSDQGRHWNQSQQSLSDLHVSSILVDATQANTVYLSTDIGVLRTQNNGQSWTQVASGLPANQPVNGLAQGSDNFSQLFVATRGVYLYPGSSGNVLDPTRLIPLVLIVCFFALLYRFLIVRRRRPLPPAPEIPPEPENEAR
jgi:photosystem II stability/assembly factor-like uncharacterized protein